MAMSRSEQILQSIIDGTTYNGPILSRIEALLERVASSLDVDVNAIHLKGIVATTSSLPSNPDNGDMYFVGTSAPYKEYVWFDTIGNWEMVGSTDIDLSNYVTKTEYNSDMDTLSDEIGTKVDKEAGKGLSSNDYTTVEKTKLAETPPIVICTQAEYDAMESHDSGTVYIIKESS